MSTEVRSYVKLVEALANRGVRVSEGAVRQYVFRGFLPSLTSCTEPGLPFDAIVERAARLTALQQKGVSGDLALTVLFLDDGWGWDYLIEHVIHPGHIKLKRKDPRPVGRPRKRALSQDLHKTRLEQFNKWLSDTVPIHLLAEWLESDASIAELLVFPESARWIWRALLASRGFLAPTECGRQTKYEVADTLRGLLLKRWGTNRRVRLFSELPGASYRSLSKSLRSVDGKPTAAQYLATLLVCIAYCANAALDLAELLSQEPPKGQSLSLSTEKVFEFIQSGPDWTELMRVCVTSNHGKGGLPGALDHLLAIIGPRVQAEAMITKGRKDLTLDQLIAGHKEDLLRLGGKRAEVKEVLKSYKLAETRVAEVLDKREGN